MTTRGVQGLINIIVIDSCPESGDRLHASMKLDSHVADRFKIKTNSRKPG